MRPRLLVLSSVLVLTACSGDRQETRDASPAVQPAALRDTASAGTQWRAVLEADPRFPQARGTVTATTEQGQTVAVIELAGGSPGATHPWHIHQGACESDGDYFHDSEAYPLLQLDDEGRGTSRATVPEELEAGQSYHVNVHGADDHDATVACGDLRRGASAEV